MKQWLGIMEYRTTKFLVISTPPIFQTGAAWRRAASRAAGVPPRAEWWLTGTPSTDTAGRCRTSGAKWSPSRAARSTTTPNSAPGTTRSVDPALHSESENKNYKKWVLKNHTNIIFFLRKRKKKHPWYGKTFFFKCKNYQKIRTRKWVSIHF